VTPYNIVARTLGINPHTDPNAITRAMRAMAPFATVYIVDGKFYCVAKRPPDAEGWVLHKDQRYTKQRVGKLWVKEYPDGESNYE